MRDFRLRLLAAVHHRLGNGWAWLAGFALCRIQHHEEAARALLKQGETGR